MRTSRSAPERLGNVRRAPPLPTRSRQHRRMGAISRSRLNRPSPIRPLRLPVGMSSPVLRVLPIRPRSSFRPHSRRPRWSMEARRFRRRHHRRQPLSRPFPRQPGRSSRCRRRSRRRLAPTLRSTAIQFRRPGSRCRHCRRPPRPAWGACPAWRAVRECRAVRTCRAVRGWSPPQRKPACRTRPIQAFQVLRLLRPDLPA